MTTRVIAIEDDPRYRTSLETLFDHSPGFSLVRSLGSVESALREIDSRLGRGAPPPWDLILMDLQLPGMSGIEGTRTIKERLPHVTIVVLTVFEEPATVLQAICAGADGYLVKRTPPEQIVAELRSVMVGGSPLSSGVARTVLDLIRHMAKEDMGEARRDAPRRLDLTEREQEVLRCLVQGMAYKQVAGRLGISIDTVRSHVRSIYSKLQVHRVAEAVGRAIREGLI